MLVSTCTNLFINNNTLVINESKYLMYFTTLEDTINHFKEFVLRFESEFNIDKFSFNIHDESTTELSYFNVDNTIERYMICAKS